MEERREESDDKTKRLKISGAFPENALISAGSNARRVVKLAGREIIKVDVKSQILENTRVLRDEQSSAGKQLSR